MTQDEFNLLKRIAVAFESLAASLERAYPKGRQFRPATLGTAAYTEAEREHRELKAKLEKATEEPKRRTAFPPVG